MAELVHGAPLQSSTLAVIPVQPILGLKFLREPLDQISMAGLPDPGEIEEVSPHLLGKSTEGSGRRRLDSIQGLKVCCTDNCTAATCLFQTSERLLVGQLTST
jgi:hypothetical protein